MLPTDSLFLTKHDRRNDRGRRSIGRLFPTPQRLLLSRPMITEASKKKKKGESKICEVEFEIVDVETFAIEQTRLR